MLSLKKISGNIMLCFAVLFCAALVSQEARPIVAVLEPVGNSSITPLHKMLARGELENKIIASKEYRVVDRSRTDQVFKEHNFARSEVVDSSKAKEIGRILQADVVCASELRKEDGFFVAICSLIDVESGEVFASATELIEADNPVEIKKSLERAAMTLTGVDNPHKAQKRSQMLDEARVTREQVEQERSERQMQVQVSREAVDLARMAKESSAPSDSDIRVAKMTVNRLMPNFDFKQDKKGWSAKSRLLESFEKSQDATHRNSATPYGWYIILTEIKNGTLSAESKWVYRSTVPKRETYKDKDGKTQQRTVYVESNQGQQYQLNHNMLSATIDGKKTTAHMVMKHTTGTKVSKFLGLDTSLGNSTKELADINDDEFLHAIAFAGDSRVVVTLSGTRNRSFDLNGTVVAGIAQTVELYDALRVITRAGLPVQQNYKL